MNAHLGKNPNRGKRVEVERSAIAAIPGERVTLEATLADARVLTLDMTREELAALVVQAQQVLGDKRLEEAAARIAALEAELRQAEKVEGERDDLRRQADEAHEALSAAGVSDGELPERVEDVIGERDRLMEHAASPPVAHEDVPALLTEVRRLLQRLDEGGVPAPRPAPKRATRPRAPPDRKPRR